MSEDKKAKTVLIVAAGCGCLMLSLVIVAIVTIAIPNYLVMNLRSMRAELPANLNGIRTAELAYEAAFDTFIPASIYPAPLSKGSKEWISSSSGGFLILGWAPDGDVRGAYWVETNANDFRASAISDVDGDGVYATYVATKSTNPTLVTAPDIY